MAEEEKEANQEQAPAAGGGGKKWLIIAAAVGLLLVIGGVAAYFLMSGKEAKQEVKELEEDAAEHGGAHGASPEGHDDEEELEEGEEPIGAILPLETFVVNLEGGKFLRCQMQIEFVEREIPKKFYTRLAPVRDAVIAILASKTAEDTLSAKGREQIKSEVKELINEIMKKEEVKQIYFTQFVVQ